MTDANVQVAPDSSGKKVATDELTDAAGNTVERQVVEVSKMGDDTNGLLRTLLLHARYQTYFLAKLVGELPPEVPPFTEIEGR